MHILSDFFSTAQAATESLRRRHVARLLAAVLAATGGAHAAPILFYVSTTSISTSGTASCSTCLIGGQGTYNTNTGATFQITPTGATATGTPNVTGLTSSFDQSSARLGVQNGSNFSGADLTAASIRVLSAGVGGTGIGQGTAEIFDTLTFTVAGANASTLTNIGFLYGLSGSVLGAGTGDILIRTTLSASSSNQQFAFANFNYDAFQNPLNPSPVTVSQSGWVSQSVSSAVLSSFVFNGVLYGQGATFTIPIDLKLMVACQNGASCDYSHTGLLSLSLPAGVTFTSASGVFLTAGAGVPEPAPWAMGFAGLIMVGAAAGRRRRARCQ